MHTSYHRPPLLPNTEATDCAYALSMQRLEKRRSLISAMGLALLWTESYMLGAAATGLSSVCHKSLVLSAARLHLPCICLALRGQLAVDVFSRQGPFLAWPLCQSPAHFPVTLLSLLSSGPRVTLDFAGHSSTFHNSSALFAPL